MRHPHPLSDSAEAVLAMRLARQAGAIIRQVAAEGFEVDRKEGKGQVTEADRRADAFIKSALQLAFPADGILTEEGGASQVQRRRVWVVDPLDGTRAFVKQIPGYSVMIGLLVERRPVLGVVYDPVDDRLFAAAEGRGVWIEEPGGSEPVAAPLAVPAGPGDHVLVTTTGAAEAELMPWMQWGAFRESLCINSVGIKVGELLRGRGALYWSKHPLNYWDTVAPVALAAEAGLAVQHIDGTPFEYRFEGPPDGWVHSPAILVGRADRVETLVSAFRSHSGGPPR